MPSPAQLIIGGIISIIILLIVVQVINALFNNPVAKAAGDVGGAIAKGLLALDSLVNACVDKGFFSPSCGIGIGFIVYVGSSLVLGGIGLFLNFRQSQLLRNAVQQTGKDASAIIKELIPELKSKFNEAKADFEAKTGKPIDAPVSEVIVRDLMTKQIVKETFDAVINNQTTTDKKSLIDNSIKIWEDAKVNNNALDSKVDVKDRDAARDAAEKVERTPDIPKIEVHPVGLPPDYNGAYAALNGTYGLPMNHNGTYVLSNGYNAYNGGYPGYNMFN